MLCALGMFISTGSVDAQSLGPRQVVFEGDAYDINDPDNAPVVNEPTITFAKVNGEEMFIAMWQVGKVPGVNEIEVAFGLDYSIGAYDPVTGAITWGARRHVPVPSQTAGAYDPALVTMPNSSGFIGAGVRQTSPGLLDYGFTVRTDPSDPINPDVLISPQGFNDIEIAWPRLDRARAGIANLPIYLAAQSKDFVQNFEQVLVRYSGDDGVTWSNWTPVIDTDTQQPIIGVPSNPAFSVVHNNWLHIAYMNQEADYLRLARGEVIFGTPSFFDGDLNLTPTIGNFTDGGQSFTELQLDDQAIKSWYLRNEKSIGDRIDITANTTGQTVVVIYTGTAHPRNQPPIGIESLGGPVVTQQDELIISQRIDW